MISVELLRRGDRYVGFVCGGHALYADEGRDIVCSAVSVLTINTVNSIEALTQDHMSCRQDPEGGFLSLEVGEPVSERAALLLDSLALGLKTIQENYGDAYLTIRESIQD